MLISRYSAYLDGDWPRELDLPAPHRTVFMAFNDSEPFMDVYSPEADANWDANLPLGRGYIKLGHHKELFGVTMFHQMHCLVRLRAVSFHFIWPFSLSSLCGWGQRLFMRLGSD